MENTYKLILMFAITLLVISNEAISKEISLQLSSPKKKTVQYEPIILHLLIKNSKKGEDDYRIKIDDNKKKETYDFSFYQRLESKSKNDNLKFYELIIPYGVNKHTRTFVENTGSYTVTIYKKGADIRSNSIQITVNKPNKTDEEAKKYFVGIKQLSHFFGDGPTEGIKKFRTLVNQYPQSSYAPYASVFLLKYDISDAVQKAYKQDKSKKSVTCVKARAALKHENQIRRLPKPYSKHLNLIRVLYNSYSTSKELACKNIDFNKDWKKDMGYILRLPNIYQKNRWAWKKVNKIWLDALEKWENK